MVLKKALCEDVAQFLHDSGEFGVLGKDIFIATEPEKNHVRNIAKCITIYDFEGGYQNPKFNIDQAQIQIRCRDEDYGKAHETAERIKQFLEGRKDYPIINGSRYASFVATSHYPLNVYKELTLIAVTTNYEIIRTTNNDNKGHKTKL